MKRRNEERRKGTAVVELAVCLPLIFMIVFASIEACNMIALKQVITEAAYDGAMVAVRPDGDAAAITATINSVLTARNITPSSVAIEGNGGAAYQTLKHGDEVTVTVQVVTDNNVVGPQLFSHSRVLSGAISGIKQ